MPMLPTSWRSPLGYLSGWPRRVSALLCLLIAAGSALARGRPTATVPTVVASHAVPAGTLLKSSDLAVADWPVNAVPSGIVRTITGVAGHRTATRLNRGTPVTTADLLEPAIAQALADGRAATTVELATASQLAILRTGDHVDLYPSTDSGPLTDIRPTATGSPIARNAEVLSVLPASDAATDARPALVVATDRAAAAQLAVRATAAFVVTLVQPP
jgi:Flp pilus assembly protein CpaB